MEDTAQVHEKKKKKVKIWIWVLLAFALALFAYAYFEGLPPPSGMYKAFAQCIAATKTTFYGAWWCPHCHNQKNKFGDAAQYLPYVECANPSPDTTENQMCTDLGIKNYPTWVFPDGSKLTGEVDLQTLSQKTSCPLPTSTAG